MIIIIIFVIAPTVVMLSKRNQIAVIRVIQALSDTLLRSWESSIIVGLVLVLKVADCSILNMHS